MNIDWFDVREGFRQECVAFPLLFNLFLDGCLYNLKEYECGLKMDALSVKCLLYADGQEILASSAYIRVTPLRERRSSQSCRHTFSALDLNLSTAARGGSGVLTAPDANAGDTCGGSINERRCTKAHRSGSS